MSPFFIAVTLFALGLSVAPTHAAPFAWGRNTHVQLGIGYGPAIALPAPVTATGVLVNRTVVKLAAGGSHSLALCADGTLVAWGGNFNGQLGDGSTTARPEPVLVTTAGTPLEGRTITAIAAGADFSVALCADGTLAAWGYNGQGQLGNGALPTNSPLPVAVSTAGALSGRTAVAISAGMHHALALCSDGAIVGWGDGTNGKLGDGGSYFRSTPVQVSTASGTSVLHNRTVVRIGTGKLSSFAICSDGTLAAWGDNLFATLGDGTGTPRYSPVAVITAGTPLAGRTVVSVSGGDYHTVVLCSDGTVVSWGNGYFGDGVHSSGTTKVVPTIAGTPLVGRTVVAIAAGHDHTMALCSDGTLVGWGMNSDGQIGDNSTTLRAYPVAVDTSSLAGAPGFSAVACGQTSFHTLALAASHTTSLESASDLDFVLRRAWPNPAAGRLLASFTLPAPGPGELDLFDSAGRKVASVSLAGLGAGPHTVQLVQGERLQPGFYFIKLTQGARSAVTRVTVVR